MTAEERRRFHGVAEGAAQQQLKACSLGWVHPPRRVCPDALYGAAVVAPKRSRFSGCHSTCFSARNHSCIVVAADLSDGRDRLFRRREQSPAVSPRTLWIIPLGRQPTASPDLLPEPLPTWSLGHVRPALPAPVSGCGTRSFYPVERRIPGDRNVSGEHWARRPGASSPAPPHQPLLAPWTPSPHGAPER